MKFYKQVFVIQSETDLIMLSNAYKAALKSKKVFIESAFSANISSILGGSCPPPVSDKKVYSYTPLCLENEDYDFKKKYLAPLAICDGTKILKKEKFVMNITKNFLQDLQLFKKEGIMYDACVIYSEFKDNIKDDEELEDFINVLKNDGIDFYELYTRGEANLKVIVEFVNKLLPKYVIPLEFSNDPDVRKKIYNLKILGDNEEVEF